MKQEPFDNTNTSPDGIYQTGSTRPPKNRSGLVAFLLVAVILLCGIVTLLGVLNIRLFRQLNNEKQLPFTFSESQKNGNAMTQEETVPNGEASPSLPAAIDLQPSSQNPDTPFQTGTLTKQQIYQKAIDSVVSITCRKHGGTSTGTGVVLTADGYIVTNYHVVENAQLIEILFTDSRVLKASVIGTDAVSDLAVLQVEAADLTPAEFGESDNLQVGDTVVAIGDPLGRELRGTMTDGIVSAINRDVLVDGRTMNLIQTNAALNSGNSGGPLINSYGQVVGINTMKIGDNMSIAGVEGLGFAIPSATVRDVVNQLIAQGYVSGRPSLGFTGENLSSVYQHYYHLPQGVYITYVEENSAAEALGLQVGDILLYVDETRITDLSVLTQLLYSYAPGDTVQLIIYRSGVQYSGSLTIEEATS